MSARDYLTDEPRDPTRPWAPSPFGRLARAHALSVSGDAMFTTALAGLVFFSVTRMDQARWQVAAALLFTIVPFSLAAPFIGPLIDRTRGGRKWMIVALCVLRGVACLALVWNRENQLALYPLFTLLLVFAQGYILARGALVPTTVRSDAELVRANAKLAAISGIAAVVGGAVAITVMWVPAQLDLSVGPSAALFLAAVVYAAAAVEASRLPGVRVAATPPDEFETTELHAPGIQTAASALSVVRIVVGFTTFLLAFHFKDLEQADAWDSRVGLIGCIVLAQVGFLVGSVVAIRARRSVAEEQIILGALAVIGVVGVLTSVMAELAGAVLLAFAVGLASNSAKQSFDALVQRDAPDANRGRAFARFETRFQLWWVAGALVPVAVTVPTPLGSLAVGLAGLGAVAWLVVTRRRLGDALRPPLPVTEPTLVEPRPISRAFLRRRRAPAAAPVDLALLDPDTDLDIGRDEPTVERTLPDLPVTGLPVTDVPTDLPVTTPMPLADDATIEMPAFADHDAVTGLQGTPGGAFASDRTATWPAPPPPAPLRDSPPGPSRWDDDDPVPDEAPWRGTLAPDGPPPPVTPPRSAGTAGTAGTAPRRPERVAPLRDDDLAAPSDVAGFYRPAARPPGDGGADHGAPGDGHEDASGASDAWGSPPPPTPYRPPPRSRPRHWDDRPGDPDDRR